MSVDNEVVSTWMKLTPAHMIIATICIVMMYLGFYIRDEVKSLAQLYVQTVESRRVITDFSFPTRVDKVSQLQIQSTMKDYLRAHDDIGAVFAYEFVPRGNEMLYQGRVMITQVTQSGKDLGTRYNANWLPMNSDKEQVEKLLKGDVYYRPNGPDKPITQDDKQTKFNLRLMEQDGFVCLISVPIIDGSSQVRGYITALLTKVPTDITPYVKSLEFQAVELSQYLI